MGGAAHAGLSRHMRLLLSALLCSAPRVLYSAPFCPIPLCSWRRACACPSPPCPALLNICNVSLLSCHPGRHAVPVPCYQMPVADLVSCYPLLTQETIEGAAAVVESTRSEFHLLN